MGIFNVHMPLIYGEGEFKAFARLKREIAKRTKTSLSKPATDPSQLVSGSLKYVPLANLDFPSPGT
jgi:hypothetical protein